MSEFTPPDLPPRPTWATYIPCRIQQFKMHTSEGFAKAAFSHTRGLSAGIAYEFHEGIGWVERYRFDSQTVRRGHPWWAETDRRNERQRHKSLAAAGEQFRREGRNPPSYYLRPGACKYCDTPAWQLMGYETEPKCCKECHCDTST